MLYVDPEQKDKVKLFQESVNTVRMLINTPAAQGAIGDVYNFHLDPSLTLGCGSWGDTSVSANVSPSMLLNYKSVVSRRENMLWYRVSAHAARAATRGRAPPSTPTGPRRCRPRSTSRAAPWSWASRR